MKKILSLCLCACILSLNFMYFNFNSYNTFAATNGVLPLSFNVTDSAINPNQPVVYLSDMANKKLVEFNYETGSSREITFGFAPERITYANGKIYVCLLKGQHSSYWDEVNQSG